MIRHPPIEDNSTTQCFHILADLHLVASAALPKLQLLISASLASPSLGGTWRQSPINQKVFKENGRVKQPHLTFLSLVSYCEQNKGGRFSLHLLSLHTKKEEGGKKRHLIVYRKQYQTTTLTWQKLLESWPQFSDEEHLKSAVDKKDSSHNTAVLHSTISSTHLCQNFMCAGSDRWAVKNCWEDKESWRFSGKPSSFQNKTGLPELPSKAQGLPWSC